MQENYPRPRWGMLYLVLPLAGGLLWLIHRASPAGTARTLLNLGALLFVFILVEIWERANYIALLRQPLAGDDLPPIYLPHEAVTGRPDEGELSIPAVFGNEASNNLFALPVQVGEPEQSDVR